MLVIKIPHDKDLKIALSDGTIIEFECDGEYSHRAIIQTSARIAMVYTRDFLVMDEWQLVEGEIGKFVSVCTEKDFDKEEQQPTESRFVDHDESQRVGKPDGLAIPTMCDNAQYQAIEPENIDKVGSELTPFVKAQLSTKNQMILRNILAALSSVAVVIVFILEKLGIM